MRRKLGKPKETKIKMPQFVPCPLIGGCEHPLTCRYSNICIEYLTVRDGNG